MKITYFVNTMFLMTGKNTKVLCDPWVTSGNKSRSGLYNFPKLKTTREELPNLKPDFIYISHTHADHFDPDTLCVFDKNIPILVSWYKHNFTEKAVRGIGFKDVRVSDPNKPLKLNGEDTCWIEPSAKYSAVDSIAVFNIDGFNILNANDCGFNYDQCKSIKQRFLDIHAACIPSGMQGPYPAFYQNLTLEEKKEESEKKKYNNFMSIIDYIKVLKPKYLIALTGGAVYGGKKALLMPYTGVGTAVEAKKFLQKKNIEIETILLSEKCSFDFNKKETEGVFVDNSHENSKEYFKEISCIQSPFEEGGNFWVSESEQIDLSTLLYNARVKQLLWQQRLNIVSSSVFFIDVGQEYIYRLSLSDETVQKAKEIDIKDVEYEIFRMPYSLLIAFLTRHYNYSNLKTQFVDFYRKPDIFNPDLHLLMSHLHL
ncbi:MAG: MBL fold metallo-hydrolase [Pelagibacterales bacterium]|jgi:L-ascorbate metabolism protein UlaG (beta-lactamase superfamily)|nr:MBL fold metallo-hydrolase [Pelagibacterales bacterium]